MELVTSIGVIYDSVPRTMNNRRLFWCPVYASVSKIGKSLGGGTSSDSM